MHISPFPSALSPMMRFFISFLGFCSWVFFCSSSPDLVSGVSSPEISNKVGEIAKAIVSIDDKVVASTDEHFICATMDWWPPSKCDYGRCSWGSASLLNLDLKNRILLNAVKAFSTLKIRLGGTLQDKVTYGSEHRTKKDCTEFSKNTSQMFGFTNGCLTMQRWDELNHFFRQCGAVIVFGLNALTGRTIPAAGGAAVGSWNFSNAESFIRYTFDNKYSILGWELGNELNGIKGVGTSIEAPQYANDTATLKRIVDKIYRNSKFKPRVFGPAGFFESKWFNQYVNQARNSLDVLTHHIYSLGAGVSPDLVGKILNPSFLDIEADTFKSIRDILKNSKTKAWVGEAGGAYNSGHNFVTNAFVFSFWYLDQLGMASLYDTKTYCRQSLIGGNYGLLDTTTFVPNPDYYSALLWHRLMGKTVLSTSIQGPKKLRVYVHCAKNVKGITILLLNLDSNATVEVRIDGMGKSVRNLTREEYHLTAPNGNLNSRTMMLNGKKLNVASSGEIPPLLPVSVSSLEPVKVDPYSIVFVRMKTCRLRCCA